MTVATMRANLLTVYTTDSWKSNVKGMSDKQVIAVHARFVRESKIKI